MINADARDRYWMQLCIQLAREARGYTSPNPMVGSVVVKNSRLIGHGFHPKPGEPHAEVFALRDAGEAAGGATLYVNLEPCNHTGRTPPCTEAILQAGVARVVAGIVDPNPLVAGKGLARLQAAGVEAIAGVEEAACRELNEAFFHSIIHHRPFGILKYAMTLDGKIATVSGHSQWVSGEAARAIVHDVRGGCDAVVVGGNTVRQDDPQLTCRLVTGRNPLRVVMTKDGDRLPGEAKLWHTDVAPTLVLAEQISDTRRDDLERRGVDVESCLNLSSALASDILYKRGCISVLWECGGMLAAEALRDLVIQKVMAFVAPKLVGGLSAPGPIAGEGMPLMSEALPLTNVRDRQIGSDRLIEGYLA